MLGIDRQGRGQFAVHEQLDPVVLDLANDMMPAIGDVGILGVVVVAALPARRPPVEQPHRGRSWIVSRFREVSSMRKTWWSVSLGVTRLTSDSWPIDSDRHQNSTAKPGLQVGCHGPGHRRNCGTSPARNSAQ